MTSNIALFPLARPLIRFPMSSYDEVLEGLMKSLARDRAPTDDDLSSINDPTVALADAFAIACDVLGFYRERVANESYIATATEPQSILQLARMVGYVPNPGLSARAHVYYTVDDSASEGVRIRAGSKIGALPRPGQPPQVFETRRELVAWPQLNALTIVTESVPCFVLAGKVTQSFALDGTDNGLGAGALIKITTSGGYDAFFVAKAVEFDRKAQRTNVEGVLTYGYGGQPTKADVTKQGEPAAKLAREPDDADLPRSPPPMIGFRRRARIFGHNAPELPDDTSRSTRARTPWSLDPFDVAHTDSLDLDGHMPTLVAGSFVCIEIPNRTKQCDDFEVFTIQKVELLSRNAYGLTGSVTRLFLDRSWKSSVFAETYLETVQAVTVHWDDLEINLAKTPVPALNQASASAPFPMGVGVVLEASGRPRILVEGDVELLEPGRKFVLSGISPAKEAGVPATPNPRQAELLTIAAIYPVAGQSSSQRTCLEFEETLKNCYDPVSVRINANVVEVTHGETYEEVLGSGSSVWEHQSLQLSRNPLSHLADPNGVGERAQVTVRIANDEWTLVDTLAEDDVGSPVFCVERDADASVRVIFGNGRHGARLPTGQENVSAAYRLGSGRSGNLPAGKLKLAMDHPLGIREVDSLEAVGGVDPEGPQQTRTAAPLAACALGRALSALDYDALVSSQAGVRKVKSSFVSGAGGDAVVLTVLGEPGAATIDHGRLSKIIEGSSFGAVPVVVLAGRIMTIAVVASVAVERERDWDAVQDAVRSVLSEVFSFARRQLGQAAHLSEALAAIHSIAGVAHASIDEFYCLERSAEDSDLPRRATSLLAEDWQSDGSGNLAGAELLILRPEIRNTLKVVRKQP